ncbi:succinate dehydrogenase assembly factor 2 [Thiotrichales bacterium 19S11-10]|nr:succinate dehydrogenase assembly factor 2 [Thiotrichales bacterium 19S11-10]MCF6807227.1 succinate dehydrogenase assembly factor 2 [Thiotrichales bacterium 19S9-11]MCF6811196.1 succinate dehydrogenase assembly factor 2 [Thiotrichales bacterium 19S9-12]
MSRVGEAKALDRVRWAARRGMLELDLVFNRYIDQRYLDASDEEKESFHCLLELEDQLLFGWFIQSKQVDKSFQSIVKIILSC